VADPKCRSTAHRVSNRYSCPAFRSIQRLPDPHASVRLPAPLHLEACKEVEVTEGSAGPITAIPYSVYLPLTVSNTGASPSGGWSILLQGGLEGPSPALGRSVRAKLALPSLRLPWLA
jgi:hypothetical protein